VKKILALFLLLSSPAHAALNCLETDAELTVLHWNGYVLYESGMSRIGETLLFVNGKGAFKIIVINNGTACEILEGAEWYLSKDKPA